MLKLKFLKTILVFFFNFTMPEVSPKQNFIVYTGNIPQSLKVLCVLYWTSPRIMSQKSTCELYMRAHCNRDIMVRNMEHKRKHRCHTTR